MHDPGSCTQQGGTHVMRVLAPQDVTGQPGMGRAIWLSPTLWREVIRQLESQMKEIVFWERLLVQAKQDAQQERHHVHELKHVLSKTQEAGTSTVGVSGEGGGEVV